MLSANIHDRVLQSIYEFYVRHEHCELNSKWAVQTLPPCSNKSCSYTSGPHQNGTTLMFSRWVLSSQVAENEINDKNRL